MGIEFGAVDTDEACFAANGHTAGAAHSGAVNHYGIERYHGWDFIFLGKKRHEFHHHRRPYGHNLVNFLALYYLLEPVGH